MAVALFFFGRFTAPKPVVEDNKHTIDSLTRRVAQAHQLAQIYKQNANKAFQKGVNSQKEKVVVRTVYKADTSRNRKMKRVELDSTIRKIFGGKSSIDFDQKIDTAWTTGTLVNILDMNSENKMLKENAVIDSTTMVAKDEGIIELGQAINALTEEGSAKDGLVIEERENVRKLKREVRKQKRLKWVAIVATFVIGSLAISN